MTIDVNKANVRVGEKRGELMPPPDNDEWQSRGSEGERATKLQTLHLNSLRVMPI